MNSTASLTTLKNTNYKFCKKVLMIEDDLELSSTMNLLLTDKFLVKVDTASDPFEAMNLLSEKFYNLIILDWQLPALTGAETLFQLEKGLYFDPTLPIEWDQAKAPVVIFSSSKKSECRLRKTKHFEFAGFISKKQSFEIILDEFSNHFEERLQLKIAAV